MGVDRKEKWFDDAKIGFMLHWGTGVRNQRSVSCQHYENWLMKYRKVSEYKETAGGETYCYTRIPAWDMDIQKVELCQWIDQAKKLRADYITLACWHSLNGHIRMWHSQIPGFPMTERDILQELITLAHAENIKVVLYITPICQHIREDIYGYCRPQEYIRYLKNTPEKYEYIKEKNHGQELTEEQWQESFQFLNDAYGMGAFTFDEIEYLMEHYDLDGFWFDSYNNPLWFPEGEIPEEWRERHVYDTCRSELDGTIGYYTGEYGEKGQFVPCTNPAHRARSYQEEDLKNQYFYKRDILKFIREKHPEYVTFVNNFPPMIQADVLSQETYCFGDEFRIDDSMTRGRELLFVTGSVGSTPEEKPEWWYTGKSYKVNKQAELKRIVYAVTHGKVATVAQGPDIDGAGWPDYMAEFNEFMAEFNSWAAESYLEPEKEGISYVHILEKPEENTIRLEGVETPEKIAALSPEGDQILRFREEGTTLVVSIDDWSVYDRYGDYILKIFMK